MMNGSIVDRARAIEIEVQYQVFDSDHFPERLRVSAKENTDRLRALAPQGSFVTTRRMTCEQAKKSRFNGVIYVFTVLICNYYGLNADAANLSFH